MALSIADYLLQLPENMHFVKVPELSGDGSFHYRMLSDYGSGSFQLIRFGTGLLVVLIADYTPKENFEKVSVILEEYMEISQFETESSSFKIGGRKIQPVERGIYCYINSRKTTYVYCEKGKAVRFTKVILTRKYFDTYFREHYGKDYEQSKPAQEYLLKNPNLPELNFVFQQIRDCKAEGATLHLYLESKVLELLSLIIRGMEKKEESISVKLDHKDIRGLKRTVACMKKDLAAYPSGEKLAQTAGMSTARYRLAFRKYYGTTPYEYLKEMRLNQALLMLKNSDYRISVVALKLGYRNSGHFAKLFRNAYGIGPREYRKVQGIK